MLVRPQIENLDRRLLFRSSEQSISLEVHAEMVPFPHAWHGNRLHQPQGCFILS
jgi:hypothetical protein